MGRIKNIISRLKHFLLREYTKSDNDVDIPVFFDTKNTATIIKKEINYTVSPFKFYLKENFKQQFNKLLAEFNNIEIKPKIGLEAEFYALNVVDKNSFFKEVYDFVNQNNVFLNKIKDESCKNQFELEFSPYLDLLKLINDFNLIKNFLLDPDFKITFDAKPFYYSVGSSLQVNVSLNDKNGNNLFKKQTDNIENKITLHSIAGLLTKTNEFLDLYTESENCMSRYDLDFNKLHQLSGKITSPSYNCWGVNNRTCSIRIPTSKHFLSSEEYMKDTLENRRIEYRIPSANCDIGITLYGILYSILYGIRNELYPPEQTNNDIISDNFSYLKYEIIKK